MAKEGGFYHDAERIYYEWDRAYSQHDVEGLVKLYAPDAILESPLISHMLHKDNGICTGHKEIRNIFELVVKRLPAIRKFYRTGYFTDGKTLIWEYPRETPEGEQMDIVEAIDLKDGLIAHQRIYWGWRAIMVLEKDAFYR